ncbi:MAG: AAA family ATPase, partial [Thermoplasmata archaeon]|nr:AAA family ATPase [Thermoplasmata archaeon]
MAAKFVFPKGYKITSTRGGSNVLKRIIMGLKSYSFNGYVKTSFDHAGRASNGYIIFKDGLLVISVYEVGMKEELGKSALSKIWRDSYSNRCTIEVRTKVDLNRIIERYHSSAGIVTDKAVPSKPKKTKVTAVPIKPKKVKAPEPEPEEVLATEEAKVESILMDDTKEEGEVEKLVLERQEKKAELELFEKEKGEVDSITGETSRANGKWKKDEMDYYAKRLNDWKRKGYKVNSLEDVLTTNPSSAEEIFRKFDENVKKMDFLKSIVMSLSTKGFEEKVRSIKAKLSNPDFILPVEAEIEKLMENVEKRKKLDKEVIPPVKSEAIPSALFDEETNLIIQYTFDNFVVGQSNRFPWVAALAVAKTVTMKEPATIYNPLFIWSGLGLGKTHLINAIGNYIKKRNPGAKVLYTSGEKFASEYTEAINAKKLDKFRKSHKNLDILLMDDIQQLAGNDHAQGELLRTFDALHNRKRQIVLGSDRPPGDIPKIQERLLLRFELGLVADIQAPGFDSRLGILIKISEENSLHVKNDVLEFVASSVGDNIRELEGAFNKVVAYSNLMGRKLDLKLAKEVLNGLAKEEVKVEPKPARKEHTLASGGSYLIEEEKPQRSYEVFMKAISDGYEPLLITRLNPKRM